MNNSPSMLPSLIPYNVSPASYLSAHPIITNLLVCAIIIDAQTQRVLLIQRAAHDGFPLKWECPGGNVELGIDDTVLQALCREVREETGLAVTLECINGVADITEFEGSKNTKWRKVSFLVLLQEGQGQGVKVNEEEHQDAVWASEEEMLAGRCEGKEIIFAYDVQRETVLAVLKKGKSGGVCSYV